MNLHSLEPPNLITFSKLNDDKIEQIIGQQWATKAWWGRIGGRGWGGQKGIRENPTGKRFLVRTLWEVEDAVCRGNGFREEEDGGSGDLLLSRSKWRSNVRLILPTLPWTWAHNLLNVKDKCEERWAKTWERVNSRGGVQLSPPPENPNFLPHPPQTPSFLPKQHCQLPLLLLSPLCHCSAPRISHRAQPNWDPFATWQNSWLKI